MHGICFGAPEKTRESGPTTSRRCAARTDRPSVPGFVDDSSTPDHENRGPHEEVGRLSTLTKEKDEDPRNCRAPPKHGDASTHVSAESGVGVELGREFGQVKRLR